MAVTAPMTPGLAAAVRQAITAQFYCRQLIDCGYDENVAIGMIIGAGLTTQETYEAPSAAIERMMRTARMAAWDARSTMETIS